jgi:PAS fold/GAF domain
VGVGFDDPIAVLGHELDDSPAIAWLKDLDGCFVYVNRRYAEELRVAPDRLIGRRDAELNPREVIDGAPFDGTGAVTEPAQLEYTVGAFDGRPAFVVLRFVVRDDADEPVGVCGVAAPVGQAAVARLECARLLSVRGPGADDADVAVAPSGPSWTARAQRDLTIGLAGADDWHTGLRNVVHALGAYGGWDVVTVWVPDEHKPLLRCLSMWSAEDRLREFEIFTWQSRVPLTGTTLGQALFATEPMVFTQLAEADDDRLRAAAARQIHLALLVPMRDGRATIAALELLSRSSEPPDDDLGLAMEAVALQLAHFRRLLRQAASPLWRFGRF